MAKPNKIIFAIASAVLIQTQKAVLLTKHFTEDLDYLHCDKPTCYSNIELKYGKLTTKICTNE